jgi:membrane associated rhomboid family serine protease
MLIPYNTDAPLYYAPFATVGTMIVNVLLFLPVFAHPDPYALEAEYMEEFGEDYEFDPEEFQIPEYDDTGAPIDPAQRQEMEKQLEALRKLQAERAAGPPAPGGTTIMRLMTLEFGKFRPWQWLTANYMHADLLHLLGNLFVLWGFGLVVEGKVGWWKFLLIYNLIGILGWGLVQMLTIFADEGIGLGASLAIFGILVIALVWAPANDMQCVFMLGLRPIVFEASILQIATFAVFLQLGISALHIVMFSDDIGMALSITSEILHLIGGVFGLVVGVYMVKKNLVDCENWDVFSVWAGKNVKTIEDDRVDVAQQLEKIKNMERKKLAPPAETTAPRVATNTNEAMLTQFRNLVGAGRPVDAWGVFCLAQQQSIDWHVPEPDFVSYISALRKQKLWDHAAGAMQEYLTRYFERETMIRLALAQIQVQFLHQPREAWQTLHSVNAALISPTEKQAYDKIRAACKQAVAASKAQKPPGAV